MKIRQATILGAILYFTVGAFLSTNSALALTIDSFDEVCSGNVCQVTTTNSAPISVVPSVITTTKAIGGTRRITITKTVGTGRLTTALDTGTFSHSQDNAVRGKTLIVWDGHNSTGTITPNGLGSVNFFQDGADSVVLKNFSHDLAGQLKITMFDASDPSGQSTWSYTYAFPASAPDALPIDLTIPFTSFVADSPGVVIDFTKIGAITLLVDGTTTSALDLSFDIIGTNGTCDLPTDIPNLTGAVIDQCGQCISQNPALDNRACVDCVGVPNGNTLPGSNCSTGEIGLCNPGTWVLVSSGPPKSCSCKRNYEPTQEICDGIDNNCSGASDESFPLKGSKCGIGSNGCTAEGSYRCATDGSLFCDANLLQSQVDDCNAHRGCDGVPFSGLTIDSCGICGGDGTSCLDCNGVKNGAATLDRCGVCGGDGNSCLGCSDFNITQIQTSLDVTAKQQEAELKVIYTRIEKSAHGDKKILSKVKALRAEAHKLQIRNWTISWTFPSITTKCENTVFCTTNSNQYLKDEYAAHSEQLRQMMTDALAIYKKVAKIKNKAYGASFISKMQTLYDRSMNSLSEVPATQTSCT